MATDTANALLALHAGPGFVIPNVWDAGSARILEQVGFPAIATTSAGIAWSRGVPDGGALDLDTMFEQVRNIVAAVDVPVTADLEAGYGDTPDEVARTVTRAVDLGVVGANIEDAAEGRLFGLEESVERLAAARAAAPSGTFVLNARTDTYLHGTATGRFDATVERAVRYVDAGADCIFVPGVDDAETIRRLAAAIPLPSMSWPGSPRTSSTPRRSSRSASSASAWAAAWLEPCSASWSAPAASCSIRARSASSTVP